MPGQLIISQLEEGWRSHIAKSLVADAALKSIFVGMCLFLMQIRVCES